MRKAAVSLVLITILIISTAVWVVNSHMYVKSHTNNVKITAIADLGGFQPVVGLLIGSRVSITIQNEGINPVSNLTLTVTLVHNSTGEPLVHNLAHVEHIDSLQIGESKEIEGWYYWGLGDSWTDAYGNSDAVFVVTLTLGDVVLDERTEPTSR